MTASVADLEALRPALTGFCYRMLGCAADTDDAVQEAILRASGQLHRFTPARASLKTWVFRIATNVCLDMLRAAGRRAAPADVGALLEGGWVQPMPDSRLLGGADPADPADLVVRRETVRLAFVAALRTLPPRQRAVLILRDVLGVPAAECASMVDGTVASVNSALQRARATMAASHRAEPGAITDEQQDLLRRYVTAFEAHDMAGLTAVLCEDAVATMPPSPWRVSGGARIAELVANSDGCAGAVLVPTAINGGPGFGQYRPGADGALHPFALIAVDLRGARIAAVTTFLDTADRFAEFGLPDVLHRAAR